MSLSLPVACSCDRFFYCKLSPTLAIRVYQAKLERLLQIYPQEEVESKRWEKIAKALGNRTTKQVRLNSVTGGQQDLKANANGSNN